MTELELYKYTLLECNKNQAPTLLIDDYNYYFKKATYDVIESFIKVDEIDERTDEYLTALKKPYYITAKQLLTTYGVDKTAYQFYLPQDFFRLKNCIAVYKYNKVFGCNKVNDTITYGAARMTAEIEPVYSWNYYIVPKWFNPYYYIIKPDNMPNDIDTNVNQFGVEFHIGSLPSYLSLDGIRGWYFKIPKTILLTQDDIDADEDTTDQLEFPENICIKIIDRIVALLLEHDSNPRLQTNLPLNMDTTPERK